jgi:hypothetical protein
LGEAEAAVGRGGGIAGSRSAEQDARALHGRPGDGVAQDHLNDSRRFLCMEQRRQERNRQDLHAVFRISGRAIHGPQRAESVRVLSFYVATDPGIYVEILMDASIDEIWRCTQFRACMNFWDCV